MTSKGDILSEGTAFNFWIHGTDGMLGFDDMGSSSHKFG